MKITDDWLMRYRTPRGGWTRAQVEAIGVTWPLVHGWKARLVGQEIPDDQARAFERLGPEPRATKAYRENRKLPNLDLFDAGR